MNFFQQGNLNLRILGILLVFPPHTGEGSEKGLRLGTVGGVSSIHGGRLGNPFCETQRI